MASSVRSNSSASAADTASVPCTTCRKRRVKCDKRLPGCIRCEKSAQPCPGYNRLRSFLDQGEALRQKYSEPGSRPKAPKDGKQAPSSVPAGQSPLRSPPVPLVQPAPQIVSQPTTSATGHFVPGQLDPAQLGGSGQQDTLSSLMSLDSLSDSEFEATFFDIDPNIYFAEGNNCCGWIPNAPLLNDLQDSQAPTISWLNQITPGNFSDSSPYPDTTMTSVMTSESPKDSACGNDEYETAHLVQHFSENIGPYLDVFDIEKYFGHVVPVRARRSNLLTNSLAAIAAKQFAKTRRDHPNFVPPGSGAFLEQYYGDSSVDWFYKAASFYDKAICQMMGSLQSLRDGTLDTPAQPTPPAPGSEDGENLAAGNPAARKKRQRTDRPKTPASVLDDLLAAVSIFLLYESLDNRQLEINQHMSGAQHLLMKNLPAMDQSQSTLHQQSPAPLRSFDTVKAWQASFWNVVRIDYVVSYVERTRPRLDISDPYLWQAAGLPLRDVDGLKIPESLCVGREQSYASGSAPMTETAACRTLLWLVLKGLTYAADERDESRTMEFTPNPGPLPRSRPAIDPHAWYVLRENLETWQASVPDSFEPYLRLPQSRPSQVQTPSLSEISGPGSDSAATIQFPTLHYSSSMASTATVLYHFIQIFLLLHKPLAPSTSPDPFPRFASRRLAAYRQVSREIDDHAGKICGICLGRPDDSVRMHLMQPLHLAGLGIESSEQRVVLEGLLEGIQRGTGASTEWILLSLREEWGWTDVVS